MEVGSEALGDVLSPCRLPEGPTWGRQKVDKAIHSVPRPGPWPRNPQWLRSLDVFRTPPPVAKADVHPRAVRNLPIRSDALAIHRRVNDAHGFAAMAAGVAEGAAHPAVQGFDRGVENAAGSIEVTRAECVRVAR
jgi:hypothetical protein